MMADFSTTRKTSFRKFYYVVCMHESTDDVLKVHEGRLYQVVTAKSTFRKQVGGQILQLRDVETGKDAGSWFSGRFYLVAWADNLGDQLHKVRDNVPNHLELFAQAHADWNYDPPEAEDQNGEGKGGPGLKDDGGKVMASLPFIYFPKALTLVAEVATMGAKKYSVGGWRTVPDGLQRYTDAMYRHLLQWSETEKDEESGLPHLAHAAWNALAVLQMIEEMKADEDTTGPDED